MNAVKYTYILNCLTIYTQTIKIYLCLILALVFWVILNVNNLKIVDKRKCLCQKYFYSICLCWFNKVPG